MKAKFFLSDEGFGHIVRQRAIIDALLILKPELSVSIQTQKHLNFAKQNIAAKEFKDTFNLIKWHKKADSSPDLDAITEYYDNYTSISDDFLIEHAAQSFNSDFIVSDFVYEAFEIANNQSIPSFGVCHFTWDWFFAKLFPPPISRKVLRRFFNQAKAADILFFPPFTPPEILAFYKDNACQVPFIRRSFISHKAWPKNNKAFKVLVMDSGAGLLKDKILKALNSLELENTDFFFGSPYLLEIENSFQIPPNELLIDYINEADVVIGRPGFNTLSECLSLKKPMLIISEAMNPEMEHNLGELKKNRLGAFLSLGDFTDNLPNALTRFFEKEYHNIQEAINAFDAPSNGAEVIAEIITERVYG